MGTHRTGVQSQADVRPNANENGQFSRQEQRLGALSHLLDCFDVLLADDEHMQSRKLAAERLI